MGMIKQNKGKYNTFFYNYEKEERLDRTYLKKINTNKYIWRQRGRRKQKNKEETEVANYA